MNKLFTQEGDEIFIDECDYELISKFRYRTVIKNGKFHKRPGIAGTCIGPQHLILGQQDKGFVIDHIDRNPFNNKRNNLRIVTTQQNNFNRSKTKKETTSKYKGVSYEQEKGKYVAHIKFNKKDYAIYFGDSEVQAARAYNKKAKELFGEFAVLNDIPDDDVTQLELF